MAGSRLVSSKPIDPDVEVKLACHAGCSKCCNQRVAAMPFEVVSIYSICSSDEIIKIERAACEIKKLRLASQNNTICPLLTDAGECSVYGFRPFACRSYFSMSSAKCEKGIRTGIIPGLEMPPIAIMAGLAKVFGERGLDIAGVELVLALDHLRKTYEGRDPYEPLQDWLAGKRIFSDTCRNFLRTIEDDQKKKDVFQIRVPKKQGRNDLCSCGSGIKHKRCCGV